jgi:hypothetical protein
MVVVRLSKRNCAAPIVLRKMALEVSAIVKNAGHLDHAIVAAAVQEKMARLFHL